MFTTPIPSTLLLFQPTSQLPVLDSSDQADNCIVVARIRPLLDKELDKDTIVRAESSQDGKPYNVVRIPNPRNEAEEFSFTFNGVYDMECSQEELFTNEGVYLPFETTQVLRATWGRSFWNGSLEAFG